MTGNRDRVKFVYGFDFPFDQTEMNPALKGEDVWLKKTADEADGRFRLDVLGSAEPNPGQVLAYVEDENGVGKLRWVNNAASATFTGLTEVPDDLIANKWIKINSDGDALEFVDAPSGGTSFTFPSNQLTESTIVNADRLFVRQVAGSGTDSYITLEDLKDELLTQDEIYTAVKAIMVAGTNTGLTENDTQKTIVVNATQRAAVTQAEVYTQLKAIVVDGSNINTTDDDSNNRMTFASMGSGGTAFTFPTTALTNSTIADADRILVQDQDGPADKYITLAHLKTNLAIPDSVADGLVPTGGADDAVLRKTGSGDRALAWETIREVPSGGTTNHVLTKTSSGYAWQAAPSGGVSGIGFPAQDFIITSSADFTVTAETHVGKNLKFQSGSPNVTLNNGIGRDGDAIQFTNEGTGVVSIISDNSVVGTITLRRGDSSTFTRDSAEWTHVANSTRGSVPDAPSPSITSFSVAGWGFRVAPGSYGGSRQVSWAVSNSNRIRGNLTMTLTVPGRSSESFQYAPGSSPQDYNFGTINLTIGQSASARLSGTSTGGVGFSRTASVTVRENVYYGTSTAQAITGTIAGGGQSTAYSGGSQALNFSAWTANRYLFYAQLATRRDITGIGEGVQERISAFQKQSNTITVDGATYEVWVSRFAWLPDADGVTLAFSK